MIRVHIIDTHPFDTLRMYCIDRPGVSEISDANTFHRFTYPKGVPSHRYFLQPANAYTKLFETYL